MKILFICMVIICMFAVWKIYHTIFNVYYFGPGGCLREGVVCLIGGYFLAALIIKFWYVALLVAIIAGVIYAIKGD